MKKNLKFFALFLGLTVIFISCVTPATAYTYSEAFPIVIEVFDGYYCCLDDDGAEDDVVTSISFQLNTDTAWWQPDVIDLFVWLTLPDGTEYGYWLEITTWRESFNMDLLFYDHATCPGWYLIEAIGVVADSNYYYICGSSLIFDPPGGKPGGTPQLLWAIY